MIDISVPLEVVSCFTRATRRTLLRTFGNSGACGNALQKSSRIGCTVEKTMSIGRDQVVTDAPLASSRACLRVRSHPPLPRP
jgi:hypothetical protein